jgi:hypothetical protein
MRQALLHTLLGVCLCLAASVLCSCAPRKTAGNSPGKPPANGSTQDFTITATWHQDFTNFVPCSATVAKGCVSGFTWGYLQGVTQVPLKTSQPSVCAGASTPTGSPPAQPETCTDTVNATLGIGPLAFFIVANYVDNAGNTGSTAPDQSAQQNVTLVPPSGLAVTWQ